MSRPRDEHDDGSDKPAFSPPANPALRLVNSTDPTEEFEAPDEGLRRLLRAPPPRSVWNDDDPGPSAA